MTSAHESASQGLTPAISKGHIPAVFRRHGDSDRSYDLGPSVKAILASFERTLSRGQSEALLVWPQPIQGLAIIHALAALSRLPDCDTQSLATLFFPWNRTSGATQKALLIDREQLVKTALGSLNRI